VIGVASIQVVLVPSGTLEITPQLPEGAGHSAKAGNLGPGVRLEVTAAALVQVEVSALRAAIPKGMPQQYKATGIYTDGSAQDLTGTVSWEASEPDVAEISNADGSRGLATALTEGDTIIRATDVDSGKMGEMSLQVTRAELQSIAVTPDPSIPLGRSVTLTATGTYSDNPLKT
jgi:hypothetical protein